VQAYPLWHYDAPKAIDEWPTEFFLDAELFPLQTHAFGPLNLPGAAHPVPFLLRAYGPPCFAEYVVAGQHAAWRHGGNNQSSGSRSPGSSSSSSSSGSSAGPCPLEECHYVPIPHGARKKRDQVAFVLGTSQAPS
jgi:hypothetical protein